MATKKPTTTKNSAPVAEEVPGRQGTAVEQKLDRIIELLEGTLSIKQKGLDLSSNAWFSKSLD